MLAPMASFSDAPFRLLASGFGALWTVSEMIMSRSLLQGSQGALELLRFHPAEGLRIAQLAGSDPEEVAEAAELAASLAGLRAIDLNMGCPMPKVVSRGAGAALLDDPKRAARMVELVRRRTGLPVSVKLRLGNRGESVLPLALALQDAGAALLRVHGRTARQRYGGRADWNKIAAVAAAVSLPVVGSGDVRSVRDYRQRRALGLGVALARGALGRPWIFAEVRGLAVDREEKREAALRHLRLHLSWYEQHGQTRALRAFRGHLGHYLAAAPAAERRRAMKSEDPALVEESLWRWAGAEGSA